MASMQSLAKSLGALIGWIDDTRNVFHQNDLSGAWFFSGGMMGRRAHTTLKREDASALSFRVCARVKCFREIMSLQCSAREK